MKIKKLPTILLWCLYATVCVSQPIEPANYKKYSGACLSSTKYYGPGAFAFDVKASKVQGTIFCAFLTDFEMKAAEEPAAHVELGFELIGQKIEVIKCVAVLGGGRHLIKDIPLGFDASEAFHNYKIVQKTNAVEWWVDGKIVYTLGPEEARVFLKPMRLYLNFRPAVSHCDDEWGCIRKATLPTDAQVMQFGYTAGLSTQSKLNPGDDTFELSHEDRFAKYDAELWQFAARGSN